MTPEEFKKWLIAMQTGPRPRAKSDAECARLIGVGLRTMHRYKIEGAADVVAVACNAALHNLGKFGE